MEPYIFHVMITPMRFDAPMSEADMFQREERLREQEVRRELRNNARRWWNARRTKIEKAKI